MTTCLAINDEDTSATVQIAGRWLVGCKSQLDTDTTAGSTNVSSDELIGPIHADDGFNSADSAPT
jgi:hypothetical protein